MGRWLKTMLHFLAVVDKVMQSVEIISNINFAFMAIELNDKISLEAFGRSAGHDFFKNHPSLVASHPLISHTTVDVQKRCG
jgi:hypothetical protein